MYRFIIFLMFSIAPMYLLAQLSELNMVSKPEKIFTEFVGIRDANGRFCAAIQVISDMDGFKYDSYNGVVKVDDLPGKDMVYLSPDERVVEFYHSDYKPLKIILSEIGVLLESKRIWKIEISGMKKENQITIGIVTRPPGAEVIIDNKSRGTGKQHTVPMGKHQLCLVKAGYDTVIQEIHVDEKTNVFDFDLQEQQMVLVEGGLFTMGDTWEDGHEDEKPVHQVDVTDFYISRYEITFSEYDTFCIATGRSKPNSRNRERGTYPAYNVSWYDAVEYCNWRSKSDGLIPCYNIDKKHKDPNNKSRNDTLKWIVTWNPAAKGYRLPTEAEWEYVARDGQLNSGYKFSGNNDMSEVAWYNETSDGRPQPVGRKKSNQLGIYDMTGNLYEWCWDWSDQDYYQSSPLKNPKGPDSGKYRVVRGGTWQNNADYCRVTIRDGYLPTTKAEYGGFRIVRTAI